MSGYKLEKWNLDELIKNPTRNNIDKKLADIEKNVKQFEKVKKSLNPEYWDLINEFHKITNIPCLLNTSYNLHGEPMNYTIDDCVRTLALSSLEFLMLPDNKLMVKKCALSKVKI